jgi:uncharacterized protein YybS (DUF2232 family)
MQAGSVKMSSAMVFVEAGGAVTALVLMLVLGIGLVLGWAVRKGWTFKRGFALTSCGAFAALTLWGVMLWQAFGVDIAWLREAMSESIDYWAASYAQAGMSADSVEALAGSLRDTMDTAPYLIPGLLGMAAILLGACSLGLAHLVSSRVRQKVVASTSFSGFRLHWATAYASIVGLALLLFAQGDGSWRTVLAYVGTNLLMVSQTLFFVQGLAVCHWFATSRRMGTGSRVALYAAAVLGQVFFQLTGLVGLFDTWVDYRKRFALKSPGTGSVR